MIITDELDLKSRLNLTLGGKNKHGRKNERGDSTASRAKPMRASQKQKERSRAFVIWL